MTVGALVRRVIKVFGMFEFLAAGGELQELRAASLRQDDVAGIAVVGLDCAWAVLGLVLAIVAAETAGPVHVADVIGIILPVGLHLGKEIVPVNALNDRDHCGEAWVVRITRREGSGDAVPGLAVAGVGAS